VHRGHGHRRHLLRPQGLHGQRQGEGAVDAARAAHHRLAEAATARVVAQAQHDLRLVEGQGVQAGRWHGGGLLPVGKQEAAVLEAQGAQFLDEAAGLEADTAAGFHREGGAVEDQLVLPAHLVDIEQRQPVALAGAAEDPVALRTLADVGRAGVDRDDQVRRRIGQTAEGVEGVVLRLVVPAVLADQQAHLHAGHAQHAGHVGAGLEVAALVEDVVGGQQLLGVAQQHLTGLQHQQGVVQRLARALVRQRQAHHPVQGLQLARGGLQRGQALGHAVNEAGLLQQVHRVVAGERELGEHHQVCLVQRGLAGRGDHADGIALDVADGGVQLRDRDLQHRGLRQAVTPKTWRR
jgi:hypothetical protein